MSGEYCGGTTTVNVQKPMVLSWHYLQELFWCFLKVVLCLWTQLQCLIQEEGEFCFIFQLNVCFDPQNMGSSDITTFREQRCLGWIDRTGADTKHQSLKVWCIQEEGQRWRDLNRRTAAQTCLFLTYSSCFSKSLAQFLFQWVCLMKIRTCLCL